MSSILIKNGHIIDPVNGINKKSDLLIVNGKIEKIGKGLKDKAKEMIEAGNMIVAPGLVDIHVHLREPGREDKETIRTGAFAAAKGGFTSIACMPNTEPACDNQSIVNFILEKARQTDAVNIYPIAAITKKRAGKELSEMAELKECGCKAVSDDGDSVPSTELMRKAMEYASSFGLTVIAHCEDLSLVSDGAMNEGFYSTLLGLKGIPNESESVMIQRDIALATISGAHLHVAHVSTKEGVELIRTAKKSNIKVTAEVTPHHLALTDACCASYDTNTKVNPPLRRKEDVQALKQGLKDGTIDAIASDHAPHLESEKDLEFDKAPFGMIGLETSLSVCKTELIDTNILSWDELIQKMSVNPANILGIKRGSLKEGETADITIIDPEKEWTYRKNDIISKSSNSPFVEWRFKGRAWYVIVGGRTIMRSGELTCLS